MFDQLVPLKDLRRGLGVFLALDRHVSEFDREVYNLIWNGLYESLHGQIASINEEMDEEDAVLLHEREQFTYTLYFLGLMTLLENRLGAIAEDIFLTTRSAKGFSVDESAKKREVNMIDLAKTDKTQTVFLLDFLKTALSGGTVADKDLATRLRSLKCLRDLIVHPRSFLYSFDENNGFTETPTKQHQYVLETLPEAIDERGKISLSEEMLKQSIEDARKVVQSIVERCEYEYLYLWQGKTAEEDD